MNLAEASFTGTVLFGGLNNGLIHLLRMCESLSSPPTGVSSDMGFDATMGIPESLCLQGQ